MKDGGAATFLVPRRIGNYELSKDWKDYESKVPHKNERIWFVANTRRDSYSNQFLGKNSIGPFAKEVGEFLEGERRSVHRSAYRRTSATILADLE